MNVLPQSFYDRETTQVAQDLLGKTLVREIDDQRIACKIVETEAYAGFDDKASHAHKGITPRCRVMYGPAGFTYVYLTYGIHHLLNIVTEKEGYPGAVLIRAVEALSGLNPIKENRPGRNLHDLTNGPAKLTKALQIDIELNGIDITTKKDLWIEDDEEISEIQIATGTRIGVGYSEECQDWLWRFWIQGNEFVSG